MSLISCSECGEKISKKAEACPHCGNPSKKQSGSTECGSVTTIIVIALTIWFVFSLYDDSQYGVSQTTTVNRPVTTTPAVVSDQSKWRKGGNLHNGTAREWHEATENNKLATSADFIIRANAASTEPLIKSRAKELKICISEATDDPKLYTMKIAEVGAGCIILMGYN